MQKYEFQSPRQRYVERIRKWIVLISVSLAASIFWGAVVAGLAKYAFRLTEEKAVFFVLVPTSAMFLLYFYSVRQKISRALGFENDA
ncbi:MAG: hypothetical protein M3R60_02930 [Pseudomonadota bacterium]|nr:hypothetical protein [Pseudomonadota bacterium]